MRTLFLHPPPFDGFDGGAGSRYQAKREDNGLRLLLVGYESGNDQILVNDRGVQLSPISYPHLSAQRIFHGVETFYRRFYFRPRKIGELLAEMMSSWDMTKRHLREGMEFFRFLRAHEA